MKNIFSFDVFDTCITRKYFKPHDLFLDLSKKIKEEHQSDAIDKLIYALAKKRIQAEAAAREVSDKEDITIRDIYNQLKMDSSISVDLDRMLSLELSLELSCIIAIPTTLKYYNELISKNNRVIFVSDMYLPLSIVIEMLNKCGYQTNNNLYLSSDIGLSKRSGNLFKYVLHKEKVLAENMTHYGDNVYSDNKMAKRHGINSSIYDDINLTNNYEKILLKKDKVRHRVSDKLQKKLKIYRKYHRDPLSDLPINKRLTLSKVAAASRLVRISTDEHDAKNTSLSIVSANIAAPLFTSFVFWVLNRAKELGIRRLYFIARNGQIFYKIANKICDVRDYGIENRYLYGSRLAWYPASIAEINDNFINTVIEKYQGQTIRNILVDLSFSESDIVNIIEGFDRSPEYFEKSSDSNSVYELFSFIKNSDYKKVFIQKFNEYRDVVNKYFESEGLFDGVKYGIVDIGWRLSAHNSLHKIISTQSNDGFTGFYFGISNEHQDVSETTPFYSYITNVNNRKNNWLFKLGAMMILEEIFSAADHRTTLGYTINNKKVVPLLQEVQGNHYPDVIEKLQNNILSFVDLIISLEDCEEIEFIQKEVLQIFEKFYKYPKRSEVGVIANINAYALMSHAESQRRVLAHEIQLGELLAIVWKVISSERKINASWVWFQGSLAISKVHISYIGKLLSFFESILSVFKR